MGPLGLTRGVVATENKSSKKKGKEERGGEKMPVRGMGPGPHRSHN